jgi:hypothetical protein
MGAFLLTGRVVSSLRNGWVENHRFTHYRFEFTSASTLRFQETLPTDSMSAFSSSHDGA